MDEPLASLDEERKGEVLPFIARLAKEFSVPILYVSHSIDEVLALADTVVLMDSGSSVAVGPATDLLERADLAARFDACARKPFSLPST
jgi:molybdate transport system ATP-binding protein